LTFKRMGWYLNFSAQFMKNLLFEQKNMKLWNKWYFAENKTDNTACHTNAVHFLVA
jgi:hypothetical protein